MNKMEKKPDSVDLPDKPGCYLYKDASNRIIYVGKAKNLKKRVSSYFQKKDQDPKTKILVEKIADIDYIITESETEALILENNLIKKYEPKYNINLKDSKRYAYLKITDEKYPRLILSRKRDSKGKFFGPFVSAAQRDHVKDILIKTFKIRTCRKLPKKACLRYHIDICSAPCINNITNEDYLENIKYVETVLNGNTSEISNKLQKKMEHFSKNTEFEKAMVAREQLHAVKAVEEHQNMERKKKYNEDVIYYKESSGKVYLLLFNIYKGTLNNKKEFVFDKNPQFLEEFILQYYSENKTPNELILQKDVSQSLKDFLSTKRKSKVLVTVPKKGEKKKLLELAKKNVEFTFFRNEEMLEQLKEKFNLSKKPEVMECFDISHLSGTLTVGSMVQFRNGLPDKSNYRRFKIKTVEGIDDFSSIAEVVSRRYSRLLKENKPLPDMVVIDGGKGQLKSALEEIKKLSVKIPVISIAKRDEEIFVPARPYPIKFKKTDPGLKLIQQMRDEAHRFAIKYNKLLRNKKLRE